MKAIAFVLVCLLLIPGCKREDRQFRSKPSGTLTEQVPLTNLQPGERVPFPDIKNPDEQSAFEVSEGKRLFGWYNCVGCHANGGGGSGPALMDDDWIYGSDPAQIFRTIVEGRPNGMPSFRGKIPENQIWQIVAYIRSLSGLLPKDVASGRDDDMRSKPDEQNMEKQTPNTGHYSPGGDMPSGDNK